MLADATPSIGPSLVLLAVGLLAVASVALGALAARAARRSQGWRAIVAAAALSTLGVFAAACLANSFRHFGGSAGGGRVGARVPVCEAWWDEISTPGGVTGSDTSPSPSCRASAVHAIAPTLIQCAVIAVVAGGAAAGLVVASRRRLNNNLAKLAAS